MTIDLDNVRFLVIRVPKMPTRRRFWKVLTDKLKDRETAEVIQSLEKTNRNNKAFDIEIMTVLENVDDLEIPKTILSQSLIDSSRDVIPERYINRAVQRKIIPFRNNR
jgi:hypothetical protein